MNTLIKHLAENVTRLTLENIELKSKVEELTEVLNAYSEEMSNQDE